MPQLKRRGNDAAILLYHRVEGRGRDPLGLNVSATRLEEQLRAASERFDIITLAELADENLRTSRRERAIAITFDDGYTGVLDHALPLLGWIGAPATVFVPAGFVGSNREYWWEELQGLLLHDQPLPSSLELVVRGTTVRWAATDRRFRMLGPRLTPRERLYYLLVRLLARAGDARERERVLEEISTWADIKTPRRRERMPLTADNVRALAAVDTIEIGAHTVSHPVLAALKVADQVREITESKRALETLLDAPVTSFAYPYGGATDYTRDSVAAVQDAGFDRACSNAQRRVEPRSSPFELPRFIVRDWEPETFMRRLEGLFASRWLDGVRPVPRSAA